MQDAAAALPARLLGDVSGKRVADLCAAPGGKTLQLAAAGAQVTAVDISGRRMIRLGENLARAGLSAELVTADVGKWAPAEKFDAVLLDAPCSGTGTLRRHPDIAWLKGEDDIDRLTLAQDRLLLSAVELLKPGGTLVYAVCSLQEDEGAARIGSLLARDKRLRRRPVEAGRAAGPGGRHHAVRRYPHSPVDVGGARRARRILRGARHTASGRLTSGQLTSSGR